MSGAADKDWNPGAYARFRDFRLRPALDLIARIGALPPGRIVDLGCGAGAVAGALAAAFPGRDLIGVDASPAMLGEAAATGSYAGLVEADIATWQPEEPPALVFSNAALHWLAGHAALISRLAGLIAEGGTLAVQMPRQYAAPSHALLRQIAAEMFPDKFDFAGWQAPVAPPRDYARLLAPLGAADVWETIYLQRLAPADGHPVRRFTEPTAMRPFLAALSKAEAASFTAAYETALAEAYPPEPGGSVLMDFRRLFFVLRRG